MEVRRSSLALALLLFALPACKRPVTGADGGDTLVFDLEVEPQFIRAQVPIDIRYRVTGQPPDRVTYDIGGLEFPCEPVIAGDGKFVCTHPGINRDELAQGTTLLVLSATGDDGRTSIATTQVTIDYDCPSFGSLAINPSIASPGTTVVLSIEATERLREAPVVTRGGVSWETPLGQGSSWSLAHDVTLSDPASIEDVVVRIVDLAGNTSGDCGIDGRAPFGVDHGKPTVDPQKIRIDRMEPGVAASITAEPGAFFDDVQVATVRVVDERGQLVASIEPKPDGSIPTTNLGSPTSSRVTVQAIDLLQQESATVTVVERWRLSVGAGATPEAAVRTGTRLTPAPPGTQSMNNRTAAFAPNVREADARRATVRSQVGFQKVGDLPSRYEDANNIIGGYDPFGKAILAVGGHRGQDFNLFASIMSDVLVIRWDELEGEYVDEPGPLLDIDDPASPDPRFGINMAFDGEGCGVVHGGRVLSSDGSGGFDLVFSSGTFQLCLDPMSNTYDWSPIVPVLEAGDVPSGRVAPITWDPINRRYVIAGDSEDTDRVRFLIPPAAGQTDWHLINVLPLPSNFVNRSRHFLFFDPRNNAISLGAGSVFPIGNGEQSLAWTYLDGQWTASQLASAMVFRTRFGFDYDTAREQLVVWGGSDENSPAEADPNVYLMTETATHGPSAWRTATLDAPVSRDYPTVVYDRDREVTVVFGGVRFNDPPRFVPPEIHEIVTQPSYPYLQASIDLDTGRPKGVDRIELVIGATGNGDGDALGPDNALADGVVVLLWDSAARTWIEAGAPDPQDSSRIIVSVTADAERFVLPDGVVPITIRSRWPATEAQGARLDVDVIDGWLYLRSGVSL